MASSQLSIGVQQAKSNIRQAGVRIRLKPAVPAEHGAVGMSLARLAAAHSVGTAAVVKIKVLYQKVVQVYPIQPAQGQQHAQQLAQSAADGVMEIGVSASVKQITLGIPAPVGV